MTSTDQPSTRPPAVSSRHTVSRLGAPIRLERLTISQAVREAIERQFLEPTSLASPAPDDDGRATPLPR
ncbi:hypothetical protein [Luteitalea sp.]|uniref:hypothetical protein n=1 Tax=Luteitalea sp. TaxID=2004800 RepID=UPI0025BE8D3F|nr:hypothetical protein [Luteitalea sp.]